MKPKLREGRVPMNRWRDMVFEGNKRESVFMNTLPEISPQQWNANINAFMETMDTSRAFVMAAPTWVVGFITHAEAQKFYDQLEKLWESEDRGWAPGIMLIHRSAVQPGAFVTPKSKPGKWDGRAIAAKGGVPGGYTP